MASGGDKSEKPTPERLKKAQQEGQFFSPRGLLQAIQFVTFVALLGSIAPKWKAQVQLSMTSLLLRSTHDIAPAEWPGMFRDLLLDTLTPILELGAVLLVLSLVVHFGFTKMGFSLKRLTPKFDRMNPATHLKELPARNVRGLIQAVLLLGLSAVTIYSFLSQEGQTLLRLPFQSVPAATAQVAASLQGMLWKAAAIFVLFGAVDFFRDYRKHMSGLRMTKQEIREERKRSDGDPQIKARIRRLRRDLLRRQMMREVPKATAVIVNPTHFAVAIRYDVDTMSCPIVVAKGKNWLALRIREIAIQNQVPLIENPPLARGLYAAIDVGRAIPPEFYKAIAEVLAYIYKLMGQKLPA